MLVMAVTHSTQITVGTSYNHLLLLYKLHTCDLSPTLRRPKKLRCKVFRLSVTSSRRARGLRSA